LCRYNAGYKKENIGYFHPELRPVEVRNLVGRYKLNAVDP
jgi:hypothetical protein